MEKVKMFMLIIISSSIAIMLSFLLQFITGKKNPMLILLITSGSICWSTLSLNLCSSLRYLTSSDKAVIGLSGGAFILSAAYLIIKNYKAFKISNFSTNTAPSPTINMKSILLIVVIAIITITFVSKSSPLYAYNTWCDANYFLTMGRGIIHGLVPYRDLYEQKGPLIYFIHALAVAIDRTGFFGVYLIEILACALYLYFSLKLVLLFTDNKIVYFIPLLSSIIYSSVSFINGDSCEELCLWCLVYALYIGFKIIMKDTRIQRYEFFMVGFVGAIVLWTKFLMLGLFIGWVIAITIILIKDKDYKKMLEIYGIAIIGVIVCSLLACSYFFVNKSIEDLFQAYFYNNMFSYSMDDSSGIATMLKNIISSIINKGIKNLLVTLLIISGLYTLFKYKKRCFFFYISCLIVTIFFLYFKGAHVYYAFCLGAFAPMGLIILNTYSQKWGLFKKDNRASIITTALAFILFISFSPNLRYFPETKQDLVQYQFRDIILQKDNPTILSYDFMDVGFYNVCDIAPVCRYFCSFNILSDVKQEQNDYIINEKPDFIISAWNETNFDGYKLVSKGSYFDILTHNNIPYNLLEKE